MGYERALILQKGGTNKLKKGKKLLADHLLGCFLWTVVDETSSTNPQ